MDVEGSEQMQMQEDGWAPKKQDKNQITFQPFGK